MKTTLTRQISLFVTYAPPKNIIIIILKTTNNYICEPNSILRSLGMHKINLITISYTHIQFKHSANNTHEHRTINPLRDCDSQPLHYPSQECLARYNRTLVKPGPIALCDRCDIWFYLCTQGAGDQFVKQTACQLSIAGSLLRPTQYINILSLKLNIWSQLARVSYWHTPLDTVSHHAVA